MSVCDQKQLRQFTRNHTVFITNTPVSQSFMQSGRKVLGNDAWFHYSVIIGIHGASAQKKVPVPKSMTMTPKTPNTNSQSKTPERNPFGTKKLFSNVVH